MKKKILWVNNRRSCQFSLLKWTSENLIQRLIFSIVVKMHPQKWGMVGFSMVGCSIVKLKILLICSFSHFNLIFVVLAKTLWLSQRQLAQKKGTSEPTLLCGMRAGNEEYWGACICAYMSVHILVNILKYTYVGSKKMEAVFYFTSC